MRHRIEIITLLDVSNKSNLQNHELTLTHSFSLKSLMAGGMGQELEVTGHTVSSVTRERASHECGFSAHLLLLIQPESQPMEWCHPHLL